MKPLILAFCLLFATSCDRSDTTLGSSLEESGPGAFPGKPDAVELPSIVITNVGPTRVEFEVRNTSLRAYAYLGWGRGSTLAMSEVRKNGEWQQSFVTDCATGSFINVLGPGQVLRSSMPNRNEGDMRICLSFSEQTGEPDDDQPTWVHVQSEPHSDWKAGTTTQADLALPDADHPNR